ncbi:hypothetical protein JOQ06_005890 [Pogonophryne albipinna]|uniref:Serpin domain-containing protein n=1 Tax=Pogonophryne albipinna TaxID=1090488 RepID=A0AAD6FRN1_9TELE|nr:hypothetical protein JOQ06_005890 [Pogonophryne albipinna]
MRASDWLLVLALMPLVTIAYNPDICGAKPRDLHLEPRCVYRSPEPTSDPTADPEPTSDSEPTSDPVPESTNPRVWELSKANGRFALALHKQLALSKSPEENIFMSPISISTSFAMTKLGACNETLRQIMELNCRLYRKKDKTTALISANRLFGDKSLVFDEMYQNISEAMYGSKLLPLNFKENPEQARVSINSWISNQTENLIQDTLPPAALDSNTILVLVNTIYFKGEWKNKFDKENVYKSDFHVSESRSCSVSQMYQETRFSKETTLSRVEEGLDLKKLTHWMDGMEEKTVAVHIPRFRLEDSFSLKDKLQAMGLTDLFSSEKASLPGMLEDGGEGLHISDAFHKAFLEVNEEGSEAAAATGVVAVGRSINFDREVFHVNRPFLLLIREKSINALLFTARVADPCTQ